jgi:hypothetical protein
MAKIKSILLTLILFYACSKLKNKEHKFTFEIAPIFGNYSNRTGSEGITLKSDSTYYYYYRTCTASGYDSGKYEIKKGAICFTSFLKSKYDSINAAYDSINKSNKPYAKSGLQLAIDIRQINTHGQIKPISNETYLIENRRIYYNEVSNKYNIHDFWLKSDSEEYPYEVLDSIGTGYAILYNGRHYKTSEGFFKKFVLENGCIYHYDNDDNISRIEVIRYSLKIKDSFVVNKPKEYFEIN